MAPRGPVVGVEIDLCRGPVAGIAAEVELSERQVRGRVR